MDPADYVGLNYKMEIGTDSASLTEVGKVYNLSPSTDSDEVSRNWIDNTSQKWQTNYVKTLEFTISKLTADNITTVVPQNVYEKGDAVDGMSGVTVGDGGAIQVGESISTKESVVGILKLTPLNSEQKPIYMLNATIAITDMPMDDGLTELTMTATAEKVIIGNLTFATTVSTTSTTSTTSSKSSSTSS